MDFTGSVFVAALALAILSYWPSARGHRAGVALALPSLVFGILILFAVAGEKGRVYPGTLPAALLYIVLGALSIELWTRRRHRSSAGRRDDEQ